MNIYDLLPIELKAKIKYYVLEHPTAKIIKDEIKKLRCDECYKLRDAQGRVFCKIDGKMFFANEYFRRYNKDKEMSRSIVLYEGVDEDDYSDSETSDEYINEVCYRMFFNVESSSSDDDE